MGILGLLLGLIFWSTAAYGEMEEKYPVFHLLCVKDGSVECYFSATLLNDPGTGSSYLISTDLAAYYQESGYELVLAQGDFQEQVTVAAVQSGLSILNAEGISGYPVFAAETPDTPDLSEAQILYYDGEELVVDGEDLSGWKMTDFENNGWYDGGMQLNNWAYLGCPVVSKETGGVMGILAAGTNPDGDMIVGMVHLARIGIRGTQTAEGGTSEGETEAGGTSEGAAGGGGAQEKVSIFLNPPAWLWGLALLICLLVILYLRNDRKNSTEDGREKDNQTENTKIQQQSGVREIGSSGGTPREVSHAGYCLNAVSGVLKGNHYDIQNICWIGKMQECQIRYPKDTGGISRYHCQVIADHGKLLLMDVGSTNGTFLEDGTRLEENVPRELNAGDGFYLADPREMFRVSLKR